MLRFILRDIRSFWLAGTELFAECLFDIHPKTRNHDHSSPGKKESLLVKRDSFNHLNLRGENRC